MNEAEIEYLRQAIKIEKVAFIGHGNEFRVVDSVELIGSQWMATGISKGQWVNLKDEDLDLDMFVCYSRMEPIQ